MKLIRTLLIEFVIFILVLLFLHPCFPQVKMGETISFPGVIESISDDFSFVVINEARIFTSPDTSIVNEKGDILKRASLRPRIQVIVGATQMREGFYANKITMKKKNK
jgi:hypothetical protein